MTKEEIMEMAYEAGIQEAFSLQHDQVLVQFQNGSLERFAAFVAAKAAEKERTAEREACAAAVRFADNGTEAAEIIRARGKGES